MIADTYELWICPDPNCERWDIEPQRCDDHDSHPEGDYPKLEPILVKPTAEWLRLYRGYR